MPLEKQELQGLLKDIEKKEANKRNRILLATVLPVITAIILLYYFSTKIISSKKEVFFLNGKVDSLNIVLSNYDKKIDSLKKIYQGIEFNFIEDFGWTPKDVVSKDSVKIVTSQKAHLKIIEFLKFQKINVKTTIRYYTKISDKGKIDTALSKCGFRNIKVYTTSYRDKNNTNTVNYSPDVSDENIKVIAFAILRAGFDLKAIVPYPKAIQSKKHNSIEISGNTKFENNPSITIDEIEKFRKQ